MFIIFTQTNINNADTKNQILAEIFLDVINKDNYKLVSSEESSILDNVAIVTPWLLRTSTSKPGEITLSYVKQVISGEQDISLKIQHHKVVVPNMQSVDINHITLEQTKELIHYVIEESKYKGTLKKEGLVLPGELTEYPENFSAQEIEGFKALRDEILKEKGGKQKIIVLSSNAELVYNYGYTSRSSFYTFVEKPQQFQQEYEQLSDNIEKMPESPQPSHEYEDNILSKPNRKKCTIS